MPRAKIRAVLLILMLAATPISGGLSATSNTQSVASSHEQSLQTRPIQQNEWAIKCWPDEVGPISCLREFQTLWTGVLAAIAGLAALVAGVAAYIGAKAQARATIMTARTQFRIFLSQEKSRINEEHKKNEAEAQSVMTAFLGEIASITSGCLLSYDELHEERQKGTKLLNQRLKLRTQENIIFKTFAPKVGMLPPSIVSSIITFYGNHETMTHGNKEMERGGLLMAVASEENIVRWLNYEKALVISGLNLMENINTILAPDSNFEEILDKRHKELLGKHGISRTRRAKQ